MKRIDAVRRNGHLLEEQQRKSRGNRCGREGQLSAWLRFMCSTPARKQEFQFFLQTQVFSLRSVRAWLSMDF